MSWMYGCHRGFPVDGWHVCCVILSRLAWWMPACAWVWVRVCCVHCSTCLSPLTHPRLPPPPLDDEFVWPVCLFRRYTAVRGVLTHSLSVFPSVFLSACVGFRSLSGLFFRHHVHALMPHTRLPSHSTPAHSQSAVPCVDAPLAAETEPKPMPRSPTYLLACFLVACVLFPCRCFKRGEVVRGGTNRSSTSLSLCLPACLPGWMDGCGSVSKEGTPPSPHRLDPPMQLCFSFLAGFLDASDGSFLLV